MRTKRATAAVAAALGLIFTGVTTAPAASADEPPPTSPHEIAAEVQQATDTALSYWQGYFPAHWGGEFSPVSVWNGADGRYAMFDARGGDAPTCNGTVLGGDNAWHCPMAYRDGNWFSIDATYAQRATSLGDMWIWVIMSHEIGHAVADRIGGYKAAAYELQADCFSGAALAGLASAGALTFDAGDRDEVAFIFSEQSGFGDGVPYGTDPAQTHGSVQQRAQAYDVGRAGGPDACLVGNGSF